MSSLSTSAHLSANYLVPVVVAVAHVAVLLIARKRPVYSDTGRKKQDDLPPTTLKVGFKKGYLLCKDQGFYCPGMNEYGQLPVVLTHAMSNLFVGTSFILLLLYNLYLFDGYSPALLAFPLISLPMLTFFRKMQQESLSKVVVEDANGSDEKERDVGSHRVDGFIHVLFILAGYMLLLALGGHKHRMDLLLISLILYCVTLFGIGLRFVVQQASLETYAAEVVYGQIYLTFSRNQVYMFLATAMGAIVFQIVALMQKDRELYAFPILLFCILPILSLGFLAWQNRAYTGWAFLFNGSLNLMLLISIYMLHCSFCEIGGVECKAEFSNWVKRHVDVNIKQALYLLPATLSVMMVTLGQAYSSVQVSAIFAPIMSDKDPESPEEA